MKKVIYFILFISLIILTCACSIIDNKRLNNKTITNYVPNEEVAIKIAEAIWLPIYGEKIYDQKPYIIYLLKDSVWIVTGTLPENELGGTAYIEIQKSDGKILKVTHGK